MRFAHFAHVWGKRGMTPHERYEQLWRELAVADDVGFDYAFSVEHHFTPQESWMSSPNLFAVAAAATSAPGAASRCTVFRGPSPEKGGSAKEKNKDYDTRQDRSGSAPVPLYHVP